MGEIHVLRRLVEPVSVPLHSVRSAVIRVKIDSLGKHISQLSLLFLSVNTA